jgi:hypothetical protein
MQDLVLNPGWDTFLVASGFIVTMIMGVFQLDAALASPKGGRRLFNRASGMDENGDPILCDPDGRVWGEPAALRVTRLILPGAAPPAAACGLPGSRPCRSLGTLQRRRLNY